MDFETATDLELEQALACLVYKCDGWELSKTGGSFHSCGIDGSASYVQPIPKYCTDISTTWPLMIEHGLSITTELQCVTVSNFSPDAWLDDENERISIVCIGREHTLRAIVICLIKVLEAKHERT